MAGILEFAATTTPTKFQLMMAGVVPRRNPRRGRGSWKTNRGVFAMSKKITLNFELDDIYGLWHTSTRSFYFDQIDRFEAMRAVKSEAIQADEGNYMYWIDGYASVLLFTKVLNAFGHSTIILTDAASEDANEYVVLTDFAGNWDSEEGGNL